MKKLRNKVFVVIFSLLTLFTFFIFITSITRSYLERFNTIKNTLTSKPMTFDPRNKDMDPGNEDYQEQRRIFLDFDIYTVILDDNGSYAGLINNTYDEIDEKNVKKIAENIIANHKDNIHIGNLYTEKYSYAFQKDNILIIMDNTELNSRLIAQLYNRVLTFVITELIIFMISYLMTKWITIPVKNSFDKQKTFVADASHELKTPLAVIVASCDAYQNDKDEKWVNNIKNESERMIKLVKELLDLAKTEEEQELVLSNNNLSEIVESSILTFESLFYDNNIKLKYDIEDNIKLPCNEDSIIELMSILIDNARKHTDENGKVLVSLHKKNNINLRNKQIILEVKNSGKPIKKGDEEKIFERFYKVDSSRNRDSNNYGLGLAIAKNIVTKHNGTIEAFSNKGFTTFRVTWNQK